MPRTSLVLYCVLALGLPAVSGCGGCGESRTEPIMELSEEHKKQIQELDQQRKDEWGNPQK